MNRAYSVLTVKTVDEDKRIIAGIATTPTPDRIGDIVEPDGAMFKLPIPLLWQHMSSKPIGHVTAAEISADGISITAQIADIQEPGVLKERLDEAWQSIKAGLVRGLSIGFQPVEESFIKETFSFRFIKWLWLELSAVTIPANEEATITAIKSIDAAHRGPVSAVRLMPPASAGATKSKIILPPGRSGETTSHKQPPASVGVPALKGTDMKTIAEQIAGLEATSVAKRTRMQEVMQRSMDEGRSTDAAEREEFDTLEGEVEAIDGDIKRLKALERAAAASATPVGEVKTAVDGALARAGSLAAVPVKPQLDKGIPFARYCMCLAAGRGNLMQSLEIAKSRFGENDDTVGVLKAAVAGGTTTTPAWAGSLVEAYPRFMGDFIEYLRPMTILGKFGTNGIPSLRTVPFNVSVPRQTTGGTGYWVGEAKAKPLTKYDFDTVTIRWAKLAAIAVLTDELVRFSNPSAETLVRDQLAASVRATMDNDFIDPAKAVDLNISPASITNLVTPIPSSGTDADAIRADIAAIMEAYIAANMTPSSGVWIMPSTIAMRLGLMRNALGQVEFPGVSMMGGTFEGLPVIASEYVPATNVIIVNASDIMLADDGVVTVDASREAAIEMSDAPLGHSGTGTGASLVSMFQTNSVALRAERYINWVKARAEAVQMLSGVAWGTVGG